MADARSGRPGSDARLGTVPDEDGTDFALFSAHADAVDLCFFAPDGAETGRLPLARQDGSDTWHVRADGVSPGQLYGYRVHGPWEPAAGHRFNPAKLLVDPYATRLAGPLRYDPAIWGHVRGEPGPLRPDTRDSAPFMPKGVVPGLARPAVDHARPRRPWSETVLYEAHVKGLTRLHPAIAPELRGTYAALGHPALIRHLERIGVTAVELLPIQFIADEPALIERGRCNSWGYSTLSYFAAEPRYGDTVGLKAAIRALHAAGIEVILDVVYNHTAETDDDGPTLSFRGLDGASYYKFDPHDPGRFWNVTGCGNTLDASRPHVVRLVVDSLRHWADQYGVDGFRFDLATSLGRNPYGFDTAAPLFAAIAADPVLSGLKLIAEPWDVGEGGYRLGAFPAGWGEWNDGFRDAIRGFWRGDPGTLPRLTQGLTGSREVFEAGGRTPQASVNYVVSHDGFTLRDLVSYERKHNEANGEGNHDGHGHNLSSNGGVEGDTDDPAIRAGRARLIRAMLATIFLAQGVPMLLAGDELARTQRGNNNPYCLDDETTWVDWSAGREHDPDLPAFVARLAELRRDFAALRRTTFLTGQASAESGLKDVYWLHPSGRERVAADWADAASAVLGMQIGNDSSDRRRLLILLNGSTDETPFRLAPVLGDGTWQPVFSSDMPDGRLPDAAVPSLRPGGTITVPPRSVVLFQHEP